MAPFSSVTVCLPTEYDIQSTIFKYAVFLPLAIGIPTVYVGYVSFTLWKGGFLSREGPNGSLAIFFSRATIVFYVFWLPAVLCFFVFGPSIPLWVSARNGKPKQQWAHKMAF